MRKLPSTQDKLLPTLAGSDANKLHPEWEAIQLNQQVALATCVSILADYLPRRWIGLEPHPLLEMPDDELNALADFPPEHEAFIDQAKILGTAMDALPIDTTGFLWGACKTAGFRSDAHGKLAYWLMHHLGAKMRVMSALRAFIFRAKKFYRN